MSELEQLSLGYNSSLEESYIQELDLEQIEKLVPCHPGYHPKLEDHHVW
jgi:hypothetical protein